MAGCSPPWCWSNVLDLKFVAFGVERGIELLVLRNMDRLKLRFGPDAGFGARPESDPYPRRCLVW